MRFFSVLLFRIYDVCECRLEPDWCWICEADIGVWDFKMLNHDVFFTYKHTFRNAPIQVFLLIQILIPSTDVKRLSLSVRNSLEVTWGQGLLWHHKGSAARRDWMNLTQLYNDIDQETVFNVNDLRHHGRYLSGASDWCSPSSNIFNVSFWISLIWLLRIKVYWVGHFTVGK